MNCNKSALIGILLTAIVNGPVLADIRVGEGVFLNSTFHQNGQKVCNFSNGTTILVGLEENCFASGPPRKARVKRNDDAIIQAQTSTSPTENSPYQQNEGVYLESSFHTEAGQKVCKFTNGVTTLIRIGESCFEQQALWKSNVPKVSGEVPAPSGLQPVSDDQKSLKITVGRGVFLNSSYYDYESGERHCNFSNGLTYVVERQQDCFGQEPISVFSTKSLDSETENSTPSNYSNRPSENRQKPVVKKPTISKKCTNCGSKKILNRPNPPS